jgi:hypothetical protein
MIFSTFFKSVHCMFRIKIEPEFKTQQTTWDTTIKDTDPTRRSPNTNPTRRSPNNIEGGRARPEDDDHHLLNLPYTSEATGGEAAPPNTSMNSSPALTAAKCSKHLHPILPLTPTMIDLSTLIGGETRRISTTAPHRHPPW